MNRLFRIVLIFLFLSCFVYGKKLGHLQIGFSQQDIQNILQEATPISFKPFKKLQGKLYISHFNRVLFKDNGQVLVDVTLKGEKLAYGFSIVGEKVDIDIGDITFYLTLSVKTSFDKGKIKYRINLLEQKGKKNPKYVSKFIIPLLGSFFSSKELYIEGRDILKPVTYKRYSDRMQTTFLIRGYEIKDKKVTITVGVDFEIKKK